MATLAECHDALEARLATISGLRVFDHPPQDAAPPFAWPVFLGWEPNAMGRAGSKIYRFSVYVFTAQSVRPQDGYKALMTYADSSGASSVELALWDGHAAGVFGGLQNTTLYVSGFEVLGAEDVSSFQMYGGVFAVEIHTRG